MALIKNNIWLLFQLLIALAAVLIAALSYTAWDHVEQKFINYNAFSAKLVRESMLASLRQQEVILDVLGDKLTSSSEISIKQQQAFLNQLLAVDSNIAAFGLADKAGQLLITSSNIDIPGQQLPNLLRTPATKATFQLALSDPSMVIGAPYRMTAIDEHVLPVRKRLNNASGEIKGVMTAGLRIKNTYQLHQSDDISNNHRVTILSTRLKLPIYQRAQSAEYSGNTEVAKNDFEWFFSLPKQTESDSVVHTYIEHQNAELDGTLVSYLHAPRYDFTVLIETHASEIQLEMSRQIVPIFSTVFFTCLILFFVVRHIDRENKQTLAEIKSQAETDMLTGQPNRYGLLSYADKRVTDNPYSALFIDLSKFKHLNDTLGHKVGDEALIAIARRINKTLKGGDMLVRFGGDEFLIMTSEIQPEKLKQKALNVIKAIEAPLKLGNKIVEIWANIGIASFPDDGEDVMDVISCADLAMYEAKQKVIPLCFFDQSIKLKHLGAIEVENDIIEGLKRDEFSLAYQPQINNIGKLIGVEALLRWNHREKGAIPPNEYINIAEQRGLMPQLGEHVLRLAAKDMNGLLSKISHPITLSINVSVSQFSSPNFASNLIEILGGIKGVQTNIVLEVTESLFIGDTSEVNRALHEIKQHGMMISLDDFGTGYSSLSLLRVLDIDELKIDRSLITPITQNNDALSVVKSIVDIGHTLGMSVLSEGIETKEQLALLTEIGCDRFQGFYFSKPLSPAALVEFINHP